MAPTAARPARPSANAEEPGVRLFVASTGRPYKPTPSPERPLLLLHGGTCEGPSAFEAGAGHLCRRHGELVRAVCWPTCDELFLADLSEAGTPADWRAELAASRPGRPMRLLERWFIKFNATGSTVLACAGDAGLVARLLSSAGGEQQIDHVVLVGAEPAEAALNALKDLAAKGRLKVSVMAEASHEALRETLGRAGDCADARRPALEDLHFVSVHAAVDAKTKQLVQTARNVTRNVLDQIGASDAGPAPAALSAAAPVAPPVVAASPAAAPEKPTQPAQPSQQLLARCAVEDVAVHHLVPGMLFTGLKVQVLSCAADAQGLRAVLADMHGCVDGLFPLSMQAELARGCSVSVAGRVVALDGRLCIRGERLTPHGGFREGDDPVRMGQRNLSEHRRLFGCLVLRGAKCVLARRDGLVSLPTATAKAHETAQQTATRAVAEACDIYQEEIALLGTVAPVVVYDTSGEAPVVVTIFAALATNPPPGGYEDDESEDEEDLYDWYTFEQAVRRTDLEHEREGIYVLAERMSRAIDTGAVLPDYQYTFGFAAKVGNASEEVSESVAPQSSPDDSRISGTTAAGDPDMLVGAVACAPKEVGKPLFSSLQASLASLKKNGVTSLKQPTTAGRDAETGGKQAT